VPASKKSTHSIEKINRSSMSDNEEMATQENNLFVSPIAEPLMAGKLYSKTLKLVRKAAEAKSIRRGVPEVVKAIRKGQKGVVILAADVFPVEVLAHLPIFCEEKNVVYSYVPSRQALGTACLTKRAASAIMVFEPKGDSSYQKYYDVVAKGMRNINKYI
jgi:H/ACA ribonucleoprotein complex subunit 2